MRHARAVLEDLVLHVQPPKGCAIVLTERPFSRASDPNWIATVGPMVSEYARRYTPVMRSQREWVVPQRHSRMPTKKVVKPEQTEEVRLQQQQPDTERYQLQI